jgi:hypothetical protein
MVNSILLSSVAAVVTAAILVYINLRMLRTKCQCELLGCQCPPNYEYIGVISAVIGCLSYVLCMYM